MAEAAPLVVVIEDLHWADTSSRELLGFLVDRLRGPVLVVGTYRSDAMHRRHPLRPFLAQTARSDRVTRLELTPLTPEEVASQLEGIAARALPAALVAAVVARAEGNPFFAEELFAAGGGGAVPPSLAEVLAARLDALPDAARNLVGVAAVAGRRVRHELLAEVAGLSGPELAAGLREATAHQVLVADDGGGYAFRHALLAEVAYAELLPAERAPLHGACAAALSQHREWAADPSRAAGELTHHYAAAHDLERALQCSVEAAASAVGSYAFVEAHALYEQALGLWDQVASPGEVARCGRPQLSQRAAEAALLAGDTKRAIVLLRSELEDLDPAAEPVRAALLHERLARLLESSGRGEEALAANRAAVALMPDEASAARARILGGEARALMLAGRCHDSRARCEEAIAVARAAGARREEGYALNTLGAALAHLDEPELAVGFLEQALDIAAELGSAEDLRRAYYNLSSTLGLATHQVSRAAAVTLEGAARLDQLGDREGAVFLRAHGANFLTVSGAWDQAERLADEVLQSGTEDVTALWEAHLSAATVAMRRGGFAAAHEHLGRAGHLDRGSFDADTRTMLFAARAELALTEGLLDDARRLVREGLDALDGTDTEEPVWQLVTLGLRIEADAVGRRRGADAAAPLLERARSLAEGGRGASRTDAGWALDVQCQAEALRVRGEHDPSGWADCRRTWAAVSRPYEVAYAGWRTAEACLAVGSRPEAAVALCEAHTGASALGAAPLVAEIEALARRARIRLKEVAAPEEQPDTGPGAASRLTPREGEVLALVAAGDTNRRIAEKLFISEKTASVHVSRILAKLGVANRGQAAALARRLPSG